MLFFMSLGGVFWIPEIAFAHAGRRGFVMLLPTDFFITGGGVVVAMTFLIAVLIAVSYTHLTLPTILLV